MRLPTWLALLIASVTPAHASPEVRFAPPMVRPDEVDPRDGTYDERVALVPTRVQLCIRDACRDLVTLPAGACVYSVQWLDGARRRGYVQFAPPAHANVVETCPLGSDEARMLFFDVTRRRTFEIQASNTYHGGPGASLTAFGTLLLSVDCGAPCQGLELYTDAGLQLYSASFEHVDYDPKWRFAVGVDLMMPEQKVTVLSLRRGETLARVFVKPGVGAEDVHVEWKSDRIELDFLVQGRVVDHKTWKFPSGRRAAPPSPGAR
jgi:hypothetical protein